MIQHTEFTVAWICAILSEYVAAKAFLDEEYGQPEDLPPRDDNNYTLGRIKNHKVVVTVLPDGWCGDGISSAATVARDILHSFPNIRIGLMVGVGGGAPTQKQDVRLGDIVVSLPYKGKGGIYQYSFGKIVQNQEFEATGFLNQPPAALRTAISGLRAIYETDGHQLQEAIDNVLTKKPRIRRKYQRPHLGSDILYHSKCAHPVDDEEGDCDQLCGGESSPNLIPRQERSEDEDNPAVHYGLIASTSHPLKDALFRDQLADKEGILCFESEGAAGLMNHFPCLVIRGICDYSDTHNYRPWQGYASMAAAAYAKDLLYQIPAKRVETERKISELLLDVAQNVGELQGSVRGMTAMLQNMTHDGKRDKMRSWLSPSDPTTNYNSALQQRQEGTGTWFSQSPEFKEWISQGGSFLWLHGMSGCGKTVLCSTIIQELGRIVPTARLLYFYFDFNDTRKQTLRSMIVSLVSQLYSKSEDAIDRKALDDLLSECGIGDEQPTSDSLCVAFEHMIHDKEIWIILDALDECSTRKGQKPTENLLQWISELSSSKHRNIHLLATSQPLEDIREVLGTMGDNRRSVDITKDVVDRDIRGYVRAKVTEGHGLKRWRSHPEVQQEIETALMAKSNGMFRWAACQIDELEKCLDYRSLSAALSSIPNTIEETYSRIIDAIPREHKQNAVRILQFLAYSESPLGILDAVDIIAVDTGEPPYFNPKHRMPLPREILYFCSGLVVMTLNFDYRLDEFRLDHLPLDRKGIEIENNTEEYNQMKLQLAHLSVKEFLTSSNSRFGITTRDFQEAEAKACMAKVSLAYLLHFNYGEEASIYELPSRFPLAYYAAKFWIPHAVFALNGRENSSLLRLISEFLLAGERATEIFCHLCNLGHNFKPPTILHHLTSGRLLPAVKLLLDKGVDIGTLNSNLHLAILQGNDQVVEMLLDHGADANIQGQSSYYMLQTASSQHDEQIFELLGPMSDGVGDALYRNSALLLQASRRGHERIVSLLLDRGADVNLQSGERRGESGEHRTALNAASYEGHVGVVDRLLERGARVVSSAGDYEDPLYWASSRNHEQIVKMLLEKGGKANILGPTYRKALYEASKSGFERIVRLLLDKSMDVDSENHASRGDALLKDVLQTAIFHGNYQFVKTLLEKGANANGMSALGHALAAASLRGDSQMVELLLDQGADINATDGTFGTALRAASLRGDIHIVQLLIDKGADVNIKDTNLDTAIEAAAVKGHLKIVELLLEKGAKILTTEMSKKLLLSASSYGWDKIARRILSNGAKDQDKEGRLGGALQAAVRKGHEPTVKVLLEENDSLCAVDALREALYEASSYGHTAIVQLLLDKDAVLNTENGEYAALHAAAFHGRKHILKILLDKGADPNILYEPSGNLYDAIQGWTPLHMASYAGCTTSVKLLLEAGAEISLASNIGWTALHTASCHGRSAVVKLLLQRGTDVNAADKLGKTALYLASSRGWIKVVWLLHEYGSDLSKSDNRGQTPFDAAVSSNSLEVCEFLLENGADIMTADIGLRTPLHAAVFNMDLEIVQLLVKHGADVAATDLREKWTPLHAAAYRGDVEVAKVLIKNGADVSSTNIKNATPIFQASFKNHIEVIKLLVENGANIASTDIDGWTPLHVAAKRGYRAIVRFLIKEGADLNITTNMRETPLHVAAGKGHRAVVRFLFNQGADLDIADNKGETPLHTAVLNGHTKTVQLLFEVGASLDSTDRFEFPLLLTAIREGHMKIVKFLAAQGQDLSMTIGDGTTPLILASYMGDVEIVRFLLENEVSVTTTDNLGYTAADVALSEGHLNVLRLLKGFPVKQPSIIEWEDSSTDSDYSD